MHKRLERIKYDIMLLYLEGGVHFRKAEEMQQHSVIL